VLPVLLLLRATLLLRLRQPGSAQHAQLLLTMSTHQVHPDTEEIWRMLSDRLRQFIRSRVGSVADAEDVLQSVFLRIHQNVHRLRQSHRLDAWVFQIARNAITDHFRRTPHDSLDAEAIAAIDEEKSDNLNAEVANCLDTMIGRLPMEMQRAVTMYEREGLSQQDIASHESISLSGAKSRVQRGRKLLKEMLEDCCRLHFDRYGNVLQWEAADSRSQAGGSCQCVRPATVPLGRT
jgi:RNA polymerase sigma-70 factor (ECF subfamily)